MMNELPKITPEFRSLRLQWLSGSHSDLRKDLQLLLLVQPNCPGCHANALPVANKLAMSLDRSFDVYCVSTAFEDFKLNNIENARLMLDGRLVGDAAAKLGEKSGTIPRMPFAHDFIVDRQEADQDLREWALMSMLDDAREQLRAMGGISEEKIEEHLNNVDERVLPRKLGELFWSVRAHGTPTWVLHKQDGHVLDVKFGYMDEAEVRRWIASADPAMSWMDL